MKARGNRDRKGENGRGCESSGAPNLSTSMKPSLRLCLQSLRYLSYWRLLTREKTRDLVRIPSHLTMHSDVAYVGYGGTLGADKATGSSVL